MNVLAKRGDVTRIIAVPTAHSQSKYQAVDYCVTYFGAEFNYFQCNNFGRQGCKTDFLKSSFLDKYSQLIFGYSQKGKEGIHSEVIVIGNDNTFQRIDIVNGFPIQVGEVKTLNRADILSLVHHYQIKGFKLSKGKTINHSVTSKIINKF